MSDETKEDPPKPKDGPYTGSVTINKDKADFEEAVLLSVRAMQEGAYAIAGAVERAAPDGAPVSVISRDDVPKPGKLAAFRVELRILQAAFEAATPVTLRKRGTDESTLRALDAINPIAGVAANPVAAALASLTSGAIAGQLSAVNDVLGFFKGNYTVGSVDAKIGDSMLVLAIAGMLAKRKRRTRVPGMLHADSDVSSLLEKELRPVLHARARAIAHAESLAAATDAGSKYASERIAATLTDFDTFVKALQTPDKDGAAPLDAVVADLAYQKITENDGLVLIVHVENSGASYYDKQSLFSGIFAMPLYFSGGATVSYILTSGTNGEVLCADAVPVYGGFVQANALRDQLKGPIPPDPPLFQRLF